MEILNSLLELQKQIRDLAITSATHGDAVHMVFAGNLLEIVSDFIEAEELRIDIEEELSTNPGPLPPFSKVAQTKEGEE